MTNREECRAIPADSVEGKRAVALALMVLVFQWLTDVKQIH